MQRGSPRQEVKDAADPAPPPVSNDSSPESSPESSPRPARTAGHVVEPNGSPELHEGTAGPVAPGATSDCAGAGPVEVQPCPDGATRADRPCEPESDESESAAGSAHVAQHTGTGPRYRVTSRCRVRAGPLLTSEQRGVLVPGEIVDSISLREIDVRFETRQASRFYHPAQTGTRRILRLQFVGGWVTLRQASGGCNLEPLDMSISSSAYPRRGLGTARHIAERTECAPYAKGITYTTEARPATPLSPAQVGEEGGAPQAPCTHRHPSLPARYTQHTHGVAHSEGRAYIYMCACGRPASSGCR